MTLNNFNITVLNNTFTFNGTKNITTTVAGNGVITEAYWGAAPYISRYQSVDENGVITWLSDVESVGTFYWNPQ